jgi:lysosomal acid lipase/cholesteryl ester hydrolase
MDRVIPLYTVEGVPDARISTHPFSTEDKLGLSLQRFTRGPCDDVVLLVHGLTTSTDMFIMPEHHNLVRYLLDHGYTDVWCLDSRMSNRFAYNLSPHSYSLDDLALFDYPAAVAKIRELIGGRRLHVVSHCLGAVSFSMSLFGGAVTGISSLIANGAALTPRVPFGSLLKLAVAPFLLEKVLGLPYVSPGFSAEPGLTRGKLLSRAISLFHRECDVPSCHMLSSMWGTEAPAVFEHDHLHELTHQRSADLYGGTSLNYHRHIREMVYAGRAVKHHPNDPRYDRLPDDYLSRVRDVTTPTLFITGADNKVFDDSNIVCHQVLSALTPGRHSLHVFPGHGHQDIFVGKDSHINVFPRLLRFLTEHAGAPATTRRGVTLHRGEQLAA